MIAACGGRMKLLALIEQPAVIKKILDHLGLPSDPSTAIGLPCCSSRRERSRARPPPEEIQLELFDDPESYAE